MIRSIYSVGGAAQQRNAEWKKYFHSTQWGLEFIQVTSEWFYCVCMNPEDDSMINLYAQVAFCAKLQHVPYLLPQAWISKAPP